MKLISVKVVVASTLLAVAVSACVVAPTPGYHAVIAYEAPPPVRYEVVGVAPTPGYFWVGGAWFWEGGRYGWHPGYWQAPRAGYHWVAHSWRPRTGIRAADRGTVVAKPNLFAGADVRHAQMACIHEPFYANPHTQ